MKDATDPQSLIRLLAGFLLQAFDLCVYLGRLASSVVRTERRCEAELTFNTSTRNPSLSASQATAAVSSSSRRVVDSILPVQLVVRRGGGWNRVLCRLLMKR